MRTLNSLVMAVLLTSSATVLAEEVVKKHEGPVGARGPHPTESSTVDESEGTAHQGPPANKAQHPTRSTKAVTGKGKPHKGPAAHQLHHPTESTPAPVAPSN